MLGIPGSIDSRPTHLTTFTVKANGSPLPAEFGVVSIDIRREFNRIPKATIVINDGDVSEQNFALSEQSLLVPGVSLEILGGYSSQESTLFKGIITRHRIEVHRRGGSNLVVELRDPVFRMAIGRHSRNFNEVTDSDLIEQLISYHSGLSADVASTNLTHKQIVQHQASDWDLMVMRAEMAGLVVSCIDGKVSVQPPAADGSSAITAIFGQGLMSAELELSAEDQFLKMDVGAWDPSSGELATAEADDAAAATPGDIKGSNLGDTAATASALRHPGPEEQAALDEWASAAMGRVRRAATRGRVRIQGTEIVLPNVLLELKGLGEHFNGQGLVSGIRHRLGRGDWTTEAIIGTDPRPHHERYQIASPGAAGLLPPVTGLHIGIVSSLEDPDSQERIEIRLPTIDATDGKLWARLARLDAGDGRGTAFRPEVGDEVVIGFLDDDPRFPVILGALYSSAKTSPLKAADANHEKAIVTRSGMRIHWNDDEKVVTIDTPSGNNLVLSEKEKSVIIADQGGSTLTLSADGITLESAKDLVLKATGDVTLEGINIKAKGSAGAEIQSAGTTAIKGALVNIN